MELSRRILNVKSSPTVALNAKAKALAQSGVKVLNFAVGEPDFPTPPVVVDKAVEALRAGKTKYGPAGGGPAFRAAIAAKLKRENKLDYDADQIVVGMGAKEILFHIFLALLNEGDEVLVPAPFWVSYPDQIIAAGGKPVIVPMVDGSGSPVALEEIARYATPRTVGIVLNSPNNPSGYVLSETEMRRLGELLVGERAVGRDWWVISDEIYEYLAFDRPHVSPLNLFPELKERFFYVNGMSKGYAMTGWRVGYVAGPPKAMKLVRDLQSHSSTCLPPFIEEAATYAIAQGPSLLAAEMQQMRARRDLALRCLRDIPGIGCVQPAGAFYVLIDVRSKLAAGAARGLPTTDLALSEHLLMEHHIAVVPGEPFGAPGFLRFSYATTEAAIEEGLGRLKKALAAY